MPVPLQRQPRARQLLQSRVLVEYFLLLRLQLRRRDKAVAQQLFLPGKLLRRQRAAPLGQGRFVLGATDFRFERLHPSRQRLLLQTNLDLTEIPLGSQRGTASINLLRDPAAGLAQSGLAIQR